MPVNMKALRKYARVKKPQPAPAPEPVVEAPAPAPAPKPAVEAPAPAPEPVVEAPAPVEEAPAPEWSMNNTKSELIAAAEEAGVDYKSTWNKADILAALQA